MSEKRTKKSISLKIWPFGKEDVAKLYWVDHPYKDVEGNWKVAIYFKRIPDNAIRRCDVDWGTLPILRIGRLFKAGKVLLDEKELSNGYQKYYSSHESVFSFKKQKFECKIGEYEIAALDGGRHKVVRNAFFAQVGKTSIHIPVIEVIRAMLAKNRRLVYGILQPNSLDHYYVVRIDPKDPKYVSMDFSKDYPSDLLTKGHIRHLLWLSTDKMANNSWNEVYKSILDPANKGIYFDFPYLYNYQIRARFRQDSNIIRIEEILSVKSQALGFKWIDVVSPYFRILGNSSSSKRKKVIRVDDEDEVIIESSAAGVKKTEKVIDIPVSGHVFEDNPVVNRVPYGSKNTTGGSGGETERVVVNTKGPVSAADIGGKQTVLGLEFREHNQPTEKLSGDIDVFINILLAMEKRYVNDLNVFYRVGNLPEGSKGRKFFKLDDGVTPRKYVFAEVIFKNGSSVYLIEVERNGKALSTIMLSNNGGHEKEVLISAVNKILESLVDNNGVWDNGVFNTFENMGIGSQRYHHTHMERNVWELADRLYDKLINQP